MAGPVQDLPEEGNTEETPQTKPSKKNRLPKQNPNWFNTTTTGSLDPSEPVPLGSDVDPTNTLPSDIEPPQEDLIEEVKEKFRQSMFNAAQEIAHTSVENKILRSEDLLHTGWDNLSVAERNTVLNTLQSNMTEEQKNLQQKMMEFEFQKKQKTFEFNIFAKKVGFVAAIIFLLVFLSLFGYVAITQGTLGENADIAAIITAMYHGIKIFIGL